jgi:hydrogenase small subunit
MKVSARLAAMMGLGISAAPRIANALEKLSGGAAPVLWLQGQSCSGCSVSLLDSENPGPVELPTQYISLQFHSSLSTTTGEVGMDVVNTCIKTGGYILAVEGSIPSKIPSACADAVLAIGGCAGEDFALEKRTSFHRKVEMQQEEG